MHWVYLAFAIVMEVAGTISMKQSNGLTRMLPSILMIVFYLGSFSSLALALKTIEVSVAYAIWSGIGISVISIIGILYFGETMNILKVVAILLIIVGVVTLNFATGKEEGKEQIAVEERES
ncbi:multidrug efflux SMR transporter [Bacillus sp. REN10]|uniref:DMT family transporter n=1 Tax=Bacillus sp. REN10 TaxID=2782541 RepID=UPI00193B08D6|nr:multidrug efflux SMR transporter [Bacillus sp. REN10]